MANEGLPYYVGYHIIIESLKEDGYAHALNLVKTYLNASSVSLYKYNKVGIYELFAKEKQTNKDFLYEEAFLNKLANRIDEKEYLEINNDNNDLLLISIKTDNNKYVLVIHNNMKKDKHDLDIFIEILKQALSVVLGKQEEYEYIKRSSIKDGLTGLDNRNSYIMRTEGLDNSSNKYHYVILDLFRLKYVNDNYSHAAGDTYIIKTAEILKKYFPKHIYKDKKILNTGSCVYRIGGDEFVIISEDNSLEEVEEKVKLIAEEVKNIDLGVNEEVVLGINYGISSRINDELSNDVYQKADKKLYEDKKEMYSRLGFNRRK